MFTGVGKSVRKYFTVYHPLKVRHPILSTIPLELRTQVWSRVACSRQYRFVYIRIPKAANSTITKTLAANSFLYENHRIVSDPTGSLAKNRFTGITGTRCMTRKSLLKKYFVFSFFRNPYSRVLSAYLDKLGSDSNYAKYQWVADLMGFPSTREISFSAFISFLENGNLNADAHWAPQTNLSFIPVDELNFVGKVENLEADLTMLMEKIIGNRAAGEIVMRKKNRQNAAGKIASYYTAGLADRVYRLYEKDFRMIGYARDL